MAAGLFETILVHENYPVDAGTHAGVSGIGAASVQRRERTNYPLTLVVSPGRELRIEVDAEGERFSAAWVDRVAADLRRALLGMARQANVPLGAVTVADAGAETMLLERTATALDYGSFVSIVNEIETQARDTPDAVALVFGMASLTYSEQRLAELGCERLVEGAATRPASPRVLVGGLGLGFTLKKALEMALGKDLKKDGLAKESGEVLREACGRGFGQCLRKAFGDGLRKKAFSKSASSQAPRRRHFVPAYQVKQGAKT